VGARAGRAVVAADVRAGGDGLVDDGDVVRKSTEKCAYDRAGVHRHHVGRVLGGRRGCRRGGVGGPVGQQREQRFQGPTRVAGHGASPSSSSTSWGIDTNTGPAGGEAASWNARRRTVPSSPLWRTSCPHLDTPLARPTRSPESSGSATRWRRSALPAVTTSGA